MFNCSRAAALFVCAAIVWPGAAVAEPDASTAVEMARVTSLRDVLGKDLAGARLVGTRDSQQVMMIDLGARRQRELFGLEEPLASVEDAEEAADWDPGHGELGRPCFSPDGRSVLVSVDGRAWIVDVATAKATAILAERPVYEPQWWTDPATGELCVVFKDNDDEVVWPVDDGHGMTWRWRMKRGRLELLTRFPCDGGLSPDGRMIGDAVGHAMMRDLVTGRTYVLANADIACNASTSPDNSHRLMHLFWPHDHFGIRNRYDRVLWRIHRPEEADEWDNPRWSNHPDFATAIVCSDEKRWIAVIQISTRKMAILKRWGDDWSVPQLWLASGQQSAAVPSSPIAHLKLERHAELQRTLAVADRYAPVLDELTARHDDAEARQIVEAIEAWGGRALAEAMDGDDPHQAEALLHELAERFEGHRIGERAAEQLGSTQWQAARQSRALLQEIEGLYGRMHRPEGAAADCGDPAFVERNKVLLARMSELIERLEVDHPDSDATYRAGQFASMLSLPVGMAAAPPQPVQVIATVEQVSELPTAQRLAPYRQCLLFVRYRVDEVTAGQYTPGHMIGVHMGIDDGQATAASRIAAGQKLRLTVEAFDAHADLQSIPRADDADDIELAPQWVRAWAAER